jgi:hypothetical protein
LARCEIQFDVDVLHVTRQAMKSKKRCFGCSTCSGKMLVNRLKVSTPRQHPPDANRSSVPTVMPSTGQAVFLPLIGKEESGADVPRKLDLLIRRSWGWREDNQTGNFVLTQGASRPAPRYS